MRFDKIMRVLLTAHDDCPSCTHELCEKLIKEFPNYKEKIQREWSRAMTKLDGKPRDFEEDAP